MDTTDVDELTDEKVFTSVENTRKALYNLYGRMRESTGANSGSFSTLFALGTSLGMLDNATDDGAGNTTRNAGTTPGIQKYITGSISATTNPVAATHPWIYHYRSIRNANIFLANIDKCPMTEEEKRSSANQARFLRAYYYHELFRWFGPLVISTSTIDPFVLIQQNVKV